MQTNRGKDHPNLALLERIDLHDIGGSKGVFADDVVFDYFNPKLPDMQGDYVGPDGLRSFFEKIGRATEATFKVDSVSATAFGDELVVFQTRNTMTLKGEEIDIGVILVWRVVDGRIAEFWDIPSIHASSNGDL